MAVFLYQCPNTGKQVQGWIADDPTEDDPADDTDTYRSLACLACAGARGDLSRYICPTKTTASKAMTLPVTTFARSIFILPAL